jgi:hypothetical protein
MSILEFPSGRVPWFAWAGADADRIVEAQANLWPEPGPKERQAEIKAALEALADHR